MIPQACIDLVKNFEGYCKALPDGRCAAYAEIINGKRDKWTIGWGSTRGITEGLIWTREEAEAGLRRELEIHAKRVARLVTIELNENERASLISFDYNTGGLTDDDGQPTNTLKAINSGDRHRAAAAMQQWNKFGGKPCKGLISRRAAEVALFLTPTGELEPDFMPQKPERARSTGETGAVATIAAGSAGVALTGAHTALSEAKEVKTLLADIIPPPLVLPGLFLGCGLLLAATVHKWSAK
jgi:lysozyme